MSCSLAPGMTQDEPGPRGLSDAAVVVELPSGRAFLDLGNGQAAVAGTAADLAAVADYLRQHYPDGPAGEQLEPVRGPVLAMGWRLAEEVAWARPDRPGPEWWTLLDLAQDGRDETRRAMPGHQYLMLRGRCSRATLHRRLRALIDAGLIVVAVQSAPGRRAVYEITVVVAEMAADRQALMLGADTGLSSAETRTGLTDAETRAGPEDSRRVSDRDRRVSDRAPTCLTTAETPSVISPPSSPPSSDPDPAVLPQLEGGPPGSGDQAGDDDDGYSDRVRALLAETRRNLARTAAP